ncbi:hypothetical protein PCANC_15660 [Puccinia coronata f. sp. avenae]|uniref:Uncharacterized protein n=1 Tax=Puccinia coronata f. sp. avenae TaxID=200324 RepID=A0A2N5UP78_9BASI|nr:hypothetical protein PCANC_15660 [Puccinia coronata f. sp. avenae]
MLDALTRCPKLMRRESTHKVQSSGRVSSDEARRPVETPLLSSGSSAGSIFSYGSDSQRSGHSFRRTLVKLRQQRLRPLSIFVGHPKIAGHHRVTHSFGSIESIDSDQFQVGARGHHPSNANHSSHLITSALLGHRAETDDQRTWSYNLQGHYSCDARLPEKLMAEEESDGSLDDEMLDTLCTLRYTIQRMKEHRTPSPKSSPLTKCESLPAFGLASVDHNNLSRTLSVPSQFIERRPTSLGLIQAALPLPSSFPCPAHLSIDQHSATHSDGDEDDGDDKSSFCTLSEEEPDYKSFPYVAPIWPSLPSILRLPFDSK